jgi:hypothetical protein
MPCALNSVELNRRPAFRADYPRVLPFVPLIPRIGKKWTNPTGMSYSINARSRVTLLMLKLHRWYVRFLIQGSLLLVASALLFAEPPSTVIDSKDIKGLSLDQTPTSLKEDVSLDYSYIGGADLQSGLRGHLGEQTTQFRYGLKVPLNDQWSLHFGLDHNRIDFGQPIGSPLPYNLQPLSFGFGANYKNSDRWSVLEPSSTGSNHFEDTP